MFHNTSSNRREFRVSPMQEHLFAPTKAPRVARGPFHRMSYVGTDPSRTRVSGPGSSLRAGSGCFLSRVAQGLSCPVPHRGWSVPAFLGIVSLPKSLFSVWAGLVVNDRGRCLTHLVSFGRGRRALADGAWARNGRERSSSPMPRKRSAFPSAGLSMQLPRRECFCTKGYPA